MQQIGINFICDRCKKETFCEMTIEQIKGLFNKSEIWETVHIDNSSFLLCDECMKEYKEIHKKQSSELKRFLRC